MTDNKTSVNEVPVDKDFVGLLGNFILNLVYYNEQGQIKDYGADYKKFTEYFIMDNALDIGKLITPERIEFLREFDIAQLSSIFGTDEKLRLFLKRSFTHLAFSLSELTEEDNRFELKRPVEQEMNLETITDLDYRRNNPSDYTKQPSAATLALY